jgi:two-component system cell cycle sensor histidine kinase/response regulator CckA
MSWRYTPYALPLLIAAAVSAALALYAWRRRPTAGTAPFALLMLAMADWSLGYAFELGSADLSAKVFWSNVNFLGIAIIPTAWLAFILEYTGREKWLTRRNRVLLAVEPFVTVLLTWTNESHGLIRSSVRLDISGPIPMLAPTYSTGFWLHAVYSYLFILLGTLLLLMALIRSPRLYRGQASAVLIGSLAPWAGNMLHIFGLNPVPHLDLTPFAFTLTGLVVAWGLFRFRLLDLVPVAQDAIIESMDDGVMVLDAQNRIVYVNRVAARDIARPVSKIIGQPAAQTSSAWPGLFERYRDVTEARTEIVLGIGETQRHYDLRISPLCDWRGRLVGRLFVLRDITERKRTEEGLRESEERFRQMAENSRDVFWMRDLKSLDLIYVTPTFERLWHQSIEEAYEEPRSWLENVHPEDRERVTAVFEKQIRGEPTENEYRVVWSDGSIRWFRDRVTPILDEAGEAYRMFGVVEDITERKQAAEERERLLAQIREQAQRMQQILDTVPEGVLLLDADESITLANPVAEKDLAVLAKAKVGDVPTHLGDRPLSELLTSPPKGLWHEVAADGQIFQVIARPIENDPTPAGWVMVIRDVTQQREIQQRVQQQERLAAVGQLAAGIAHDFNNILATVVLYAQMTARMADLPSTVRERMKTINQQAGHATNLIQQILDFSRRAVLERRPLDLAVLMKEHVKLLERTLPENIEIRLDYEPDEYATPFTINADPTRMQQMMTNLALNARDAMPGGGDLHIGLKRIEIEPGESPPLPEMQAGEWVQVTVSDTGTGIPSDVLPHIFEPFFTTRAPLGSGLGLAQVHGIVGQHGGRIDVDTQVGRGTTFTIYLPVHLLELSTDVPPKGLPALVTGREETILVVEDNAAMRKALVESLQLLNYRVLEATNGQKALAMLEQHGDDIDLLLSDVVMPGMGGVALLHASRERGLTVPVVMLTGHPLEREMEELRAQGMLEWLPKPPSLEELAEVIASALHKDLE